MIKIDFQYETPHGKYADALYLPEDHTYTDAEIEAMKLERLNNWIYIVENPPQTEEQIGEIDNG